MLTLNKLEKNSVPTQKKPVRIDEQIRRALTLVGPKWEAKDLRLELELDEGTFEGYEPLLSQVWANFIDNAVKFSSVGGSIAATLSCVDGRGSFCLRDEGGGSPPMIKNIF